MLAISPPDSYFILNKRDEIVVDDVIAFTMFLKRAGIIL